MNAVKILVVTAVTLFLVFKLTDKPDPIRFDDYTYEYSEKREINKVVNIFFTPGGKRVTQSFRFLQIVDMSDPDIPEQAVSIVIKQMVVTMSLKLLEGTDNRYFGMFQGKQAVYAIAKGRKVLIYTRVVSPDVKPAQLRANAHDMLDRMEAVILARQ